MGIGTIRTKLILLSIVPVTQQTVFFALICMLVVLTFFTPSPVTIVTLSYSLLSINLGWCNAAFVHVAVLIVFLGMCHGLIVLPVVFVALPFKEARVSKLTIMYKKTRVGHQASHA
ncbi:unnamed protein product [Heligmosomoides polygyrus]|uniref:G_PROTEIN_RECEP_F1_2 domain-containing protein n=1 Tax=Heligmosomoides polygyrus TaxID=6339 RepID=A0A183GSP8_HELPZ|nr:unnamed protein product [Heligmosomoides polygyrus]